MSPAQREAHERLLSYYQQRGRVTFHVSYDEPRTKGGPRVRSNEECEVLRTRARHLKKMGLKTREIGEILNCTRQNVWNLLRKDRHQ